jgi:hypothetical protein
MERCIQEDIIRFNIPFSIFGLRKDTWYINGVSVDIGIYNGPVSISNNKLLYYYFSISNYAYFWNNQNYTDDYIHLKAVLTDDREINFKFNVNCDGDVGGMTTCEEGVVSCDGWYGSSVDFYNFPTLIHKQSINIISTGKTITDIQIIPLDIPAPDSIKI